eukprot:gb/GFBE01021808.1/.p1 GENE.gb/GFBE01021808.1/~~gb/GFBE01021808.1/.p1  ORF type:complete len:299 (+),score=56.99 gb/GFBE01021808.1/:1-897(+)
MDIGYSGAHLYEWISQADWVSDNLDQLNIKAVLHLGDVVDHSQSEAEWVNFFSGWNKIEATKVAWSLPPGNHDLVSMSDPWAANRWDTFNFRTGPAWRRNPFLNDSFPEGHYENTLVLFEAEGIELMILGLELGPSQETLDWASAKLNEFPRRRAIVSTHFVNWGSERGINLVEWAKGHRNIFMIHQGHSCAREWDKVIYNRWNEPIREILTDYQCSGDGFLRYYTFNLDREEVVAYTYSPSLRMYETDENSHFKFPFKAKYDPNQPVPYSGSKRLAGVALTVLLGTVLSHLANLCTL